MSFSLIAAVVFVLSTSLAVGVATSLHRISVNAVKQAMQPRYLVVIVLDGARPNYLHAMPLPHLDALRSSGVEYDHAFAGILESETPTGHATLSTGSTPARDGLLGFNWIKTDNSAVRIFDPNVIRSGVVEHIMQQAGVPTIASLFKSRYHRAKVAAVSGHKYYAADPLGGPAADYILYYTPAGKNLGQYLPTAIPGHVPPSSVFSEPDLAAWNKTLPLGEEDDLTTKLAMSSFRRTHQQVTLINVPEFDWPLGHVYGGEASRVRTLMGGFDRDLGLIEDTYRKAGVLDRTVFVVTADHGMSDLRYQIPDSVLDDAVSASGTTSLETTYSTGGFIWLQDPTKAQTVANAIVAKNDPHVQSVYYKVSTKSGDSYVRAVGGHHISAAVDSANQYLLGSFLGGNAPEVVALCTEDAGFSVHGAETWKGNHGGASWDSQRIPLVISGPGIAQGKHLHSPARLEDVAPTALALFGIKATGMQGSVLADALDSPSTSQTATQNTLNRTLVPVVNALAAQSAAELSTGH